MSNFKMDDYVPVNERIDAFYKAWPNGTLQSEIVELTESRVTVKAYAYREADDARPGIGHSSLEIPGSTSFTRGSEIENAETSAWGRAIAALGFEVKRGVSSREEVRNKQPQDGERTPAVRRAGKSATTRPAVTRSAEENALLDQIMESASAHGISKSGLSLLSDAVGVPQGQHANVDQLRAILARIEQPSSGVPVAPADGEAVARAASPTPSELLESAAAITGGEVVDGLTLEDAIAQEHAKAAGKVPA